MLALVLLLLVPVAFAAGASPDTSSPAPTAESVAGSSPSTGPDGAAEAGAPPGAASIVILFVLLGLGSIPALLALRRGWRPRAGGF